MKALVVVAGEGSGDALAAPVVARLGAPCFGLGGTHLEAAGAELIADLRRVAAMGVLSAIGRAPAVLDAGLRILRAARARRPSAALLVGFSELNARLAPRLSLLGTRVLWYAPPQVWAWRNGRAARIAASCDRLAVLLPFEREVWIAAGGIVDYVGHPALDARFAPATPISDRSAPVRLALLPGSRGHEVRAHLEVMLRSVRELATRLPNVTACVVRAPSLDSRSRTWVERIARTDCVSVTDEPVARALSERHVALAASGTATLECAALGVPPVTLYRTDPVTYAVARRLVRVPHIALPNLVLGRRAFPELPQGEATPQRLADAVCDVLASRERRLAACRDVRAALAVPDDQPPHARVAALLRPWLD